MESDGHGAGQTSTTTTGNYYPGPLDGNGSKSPCYLYSIPNGVYQFRICERYVSCPLVCYIDPDELSVSLRNRGAAQPAMDRAKVTLGKFEPRSAPQG